MGETVGLDEEGGRGMEGFGRRGSAVDGGGTEAGA